MDRAALGEATRNEIAENQASSLQLNGNRKMHDIGEP